MDRVTRVLHLDDNPLDDQLIALVLEEQKHSFPTRLVYVQTKKEYLAALRRKDFDIILSDYCMPGFDGEAAFRAALEVCPDIPFLMVTGELDEERVVDMLERGPIDCVLKDRIFRLVPAMQRALEQAAARQGASEGERHDARTTEQSTRTPRSHM